MEGKSVHEITKEFIREFAELNLQITKELKKIDVNCIDPEIIRELRGNAQALNTILGF